MPCNEGYIYEDLRSVYYTKPPPDDKQSSTQAKTFIAFFHFIRATCRFYFLLCDAILWWLLPTQLCLGRFCLKLPLPGDLCNLLSVVIQFYWKPVSLVYNVYLAGEDSQKGLSFASRLDIQLLNIELSIIKNNSIPLLIP